MGQQDYANLPDWVASKEGEAYKSLFAQVEGYNKNVGNSITNATLKGLRSYLGRGVASLHTHGYMNELDLSSQAGSNKVSFNLTASIIDTLSAKLASIESVPQAVTYKGNVKGRKLAEDLNFLLKGIFHKYDASHLINLAYRDAMINKVGYIKIIKEDNEVRLDRVMADEIIIDPSDGYYNKPYKMIHRKSVPLSVMLSKYPQYEKKIKDCQIIESHQYDGRNYTPSITVLESWCLNTFTGKGRHVIAVDNIDLLDEEWDKDYFPILKCDYSNPAIGWLGQSVVDELDPIQKEIDKILITMQAIMKIMSVPRVFFDNNSGVNPNYFTNRIGIMIGYDGKNGVAPTIHNGASMPPELPAQLQQLVDYAYARVGLTALDTQGQQKTGSGNTSGEALKTMNDIKSERWQMLQGNYEQSHVDLAHIILNELKDTGIKISALDRQIGLREISTRRIPKTSDSYVLKIFPVSALADSIADKIDEVTKLLQLGVIQPSQVPDLFNMPDTDAKISMVSAPTKLIDKKIEEMMDGGPYWNPEPYHDLQYALTTATQHYCWGQLNEESEKSLKPIRRFINDVKILIAQQPPAPIAPQGEQK